MPHLLVIKIISIVAYSVFTATLFNAQQNSNILYSFFDSTKLFAHTIQRNANPCNTPTTYTIGTFDDRFRISRDEFSKTIDDAANEWNKAADKKLFVRTPSGSLKINLIYDERQEDTQKLQQMDPGIDKMEASLKALDQEFDIKKKQYDEHKLRIAALKNDEELYKKESAALEAEKVSAKKIVAKRDTLYEKYEDAVEHYNTLSVSRRGEDFFVGRYFTANNREQLDVYEFQDTRDLKRLLMHEFGHSLGLDHTNNVNDVMYELNKTTNEKPTVGDMFALGRLCGKAIR